MQGMGAAVAFIAIAGTVLVILALTALGTFVTRVSRPELRPDRRGWILVGGSLALATIIGAGAFVGWTGGPAFIGATGLVGLAIVVLMVKVLGAPNRRTFLAFSVAAALGLGMFIGFFVLPQLPVVGDALHRLYCETRLC